MGPGLTALNAHPSTRSHLRCSVINLSLPFHSMMLQSVCRLVNSVGRQSSHWIVGILCFSSVILVTWGCGDAVWDVIAGDRVTFCCATGQKQHLLIYTNENLSIKCSNNRQILFTTFQDKTKLSDHIWIMS